MGDDGSPAKKQKLNSKEINKKEEMEAEAESDTENASGTEKVKEKEKVSGNESGNESGNDNGNVSGNESGKENGNESGKESDKENGEECEEEGEKDSVKESGNMSTSNVPLLEPVMDASLVMDSALMAKHTQRAQTDAFLRESDDEESESHHSEPKRGRRVAKKHSAIKSLARQHQEENKTDDSEEDDDAKLGDQPSKENTSKTPGVILDPMHEWDSFPEDKSRIPKKEEAAFDATTFEEYYDLHEAKLLGHQAELRVNHPQVNPHGEELEIKWAKKKSQIKQLDLTLPLPELIEICVKRWGGLKCVPSLEETVIGGGEEKSDCKTVLQCTDFGEFYVDHVNEDKSEDVPWVLPIRCEEFNKLVSTLMENVNKTPPGIDETYWKDHYVPRFTKVVEAIVYSNPWDASGNVQQSLNRFFMATEEVDTDRDSEVTLKLFYGLILEPWLQWCQDIPNLKTFKYYNRLLSLQQECPVDYLKKHIEKFKEWKGPVTNNKWKAVFESNMWTPVIANYHSVKMMTYSNVSGMVWLTSLFLWQCIVLVCD